MIENFIVNYTSLGHSCPMFIRVLCCVWPTTLRKMHVVPFRHDDPHITVTQGTSIHSALKVGPLVMPHLCKIQTHSAFGTSIDMTISTSLPYHLDRTSNFCIRKRRSLLCRLNFREFSNILERFHFPDAARDCTSCVLNLSSFTSPHDRPLGSSVPQSYTRKQERETGSTRVTKDPEFSPTWPFLAAINVELSLLTSLNMPRSACSFLATKCV